MKILQVNKFFYPFGGSEGYFFNLRQVLKQNGHEVIDFSMADKRNLPSDYSDFFVSHVDYAAANNLIDKIKAVGRIIYSFEAEMKIAQLIRQTKPDIVHLHNFYHQISPSILSVFKHYNLPVVMTVHDYKILCPNYQMFTQGEVCERCKIYKYHQAVKYRCLKNSRLKSLIVAIEMYLHRWWLKSYRRNIDLLIAPSEFMRDKFIEWGWDGDKIVHLPNFIELEKLNHIRPQKVAEDYVIYFGRLSPEKGIETLIRAMTLTRNKIQLKIVGVGSQKEELEKLVARLNLDKQVEFLGFRSGDELYQLVANARFSFMPSIIYENNPLAVIESLALGRAVIGARIGGIPELVIHKETGLNFRAQNNQDLAQKMDYAWENKEVMDKMGQRGRELVCKNFNTKEHYKKIMAIYGHLTLA
jgi:glycosyltransferase involved in cell wall biosynthesis